RLCEREVLERRLHAEQRIEADGALEPERRIGSRAAPERRIDTGAKPEGDDLFIGVGDRGHAFRVRGDDGLATGVLDEAGITIELLDYERGWFGLWGGLLRALGAPDQAAGKSEQDARRRGRGGN